MESARRDIITTRLGVSTGTAQSDVLDQLVDNLDKRIGICIQVALALSFGNLHRTRRRESRTFPAAAIAVTLPRVGRNQRILNYIV